MLYMLCDITVLCDMCDRW